MVISHSQPHKFQMTAAQKKFGFPKRRFLDSFRIADQQGPEG